MGSKTLYYQVSTDRSLEAVQGAVRQSFGLLGGSILPREDGFEVVQGTQGVQFAFTADFSGYVNIVHAEPGKYDIMCTVNWKPNTVFWICLVIGFFVFGILWIIPLLFLFIDPTSAYQQALLRIQSLL